MISGSMWHAIYLLALPVAINNFIHSAYNLVDTLYVAQIGGLELSAIAFVGPINNLIRAISDGLAVGGTNLIAREIGREAYEKSKAIAVQLIAIACLLGFLITVICFMGSRQILIAASITDSMMHVANVYFKITLLSTPFMFINSAYLATKRANGETLRAMIINGIAIIIKVILTYFLIFRWGMGISSLAISTLVGNGIVSLYAFYDLFLKKHMMRLSFKHFAFKSHVVKLLMIIGLPIILEKSSVAYGFIMMNKYVLAFGEKVLAGYGITNRINSLIFSCVAGFGTGLAAIISQNLGANQPDRARDGVKKTFIVSVVSSTVIIIVILLMRYKIAGLFAKQDADILYHTVNAMGVYSISVIPWAVFQVVIGVFQGTGHTKINLGMSIVRIYAFRLPLIILLMEFSALEEYSIWYAMLCSNILTGIVALILYARQYKELKLVGE